MKFLCVACDEPMKLSGTEGPDEGSMTVVFRCPDCGRETAMLTNAMETQMVRSLGVKIGGRRVRGEPMEMVRKSLARPGEDNGVERSQAGTETDSKCPFTGIVAGAYEDAGDELVWTQEAEARIKQIPSFARPMARKGVEMHARERGYSEINDAVVTEARDRFGSYVPGMGGGTD